VGRTVVGGDSAGAGLTLALAMKLRDADRPLPAALGLLCPWLDARPDIMKTRQPAPRDVALTRGLMHAYATATLAGGASPDDPFVSPLRADLSGLPPIVMQSASNDLLAPDARELGARTNVDHRVLDGYWHDPYLQSHLARGVTDALRDFAGRLDRL
jgi:acetyl esterase/lipase